MSDEVRHARIDGLDYTEAAGYLTGKAAAQADSAHRREEREFAVVVNRLRVRKWASENRDRVRKYKRERAKLPAVKAKLDAQRKRRQAAAKRRRKHDRTTLTCLHCGTCWCRIGVRGAPPKFCTEAHAKAYYRAQRSLGPEYLIAERARAMRHHYAGRPDADARIEARAVVWEREMAAVARAKAPRPHGGQPLDLTGQRFTRLLVLEPAHVEETRGTRPWLVRCDCGAEFVTTVSKLRCGDAKSCGCLRGRPRQVAA